MPRERLSIDLPPWLKDDYVEALPANKVSRATRALIKIYLKKAETDPSIYYKIINGTVELKEK